MLFNKRLTASCVSLPPPLLSVSRRALVASALDLIPRENWRRKVEKKKRRAKRQINKKKNIDPLDNVPNALPSDQLRWRGVPWRHHQLEQYELQKQIYSAAKEGREETVEELQNFLISRISTKCLAVRRVAEAHPLRRFSGCDGMDTLDSHKQAYLAENLELTGLSRRIIYFNMYPDETTKLRYEATPNEKKNLMRKRKIGTKGKKLMLAKLKKRVFVPKMESRHDKLPSKKENKESHEIVKKNFEVLIPIPTMSDRARQAMAAFALVPEWEAKFLKYAIYGYRPGKSLKNAIHKISKLLEEPYTHILIFKMCTKNSNFINIPQGQIKAEEAIFGPSYENGNSSKLKNLKKFFSERLNNSILIKQVASWIDAGIFDKELYPSAIGRHGEEYSCPIAPVLSNIITFALIEALQHRFSESNIACLDYCGHFAVFSKSLDIAIEVKEFIEIWMDQRDLENSLDCKIKDINNFKYLGFSFVSTEREHMSNNGNRNISKFKIEPDNESLNFHLSKLTATFFLSRSWFEDREGLIRRLNPLIESFGKKFNFPDCSSALQSADAVLKKELKIWVEDENEIYWKQSDIVNFEKVKEGLGQEEFSFRARSVRLLRHTEFLKKGESDEIKMAGTDLETTCPFEGEYEFWIKKLNKIDRTQNPAFTPS